MRRAHLLRGNKGTRLPNLLIAFDTETDEVALTNDSVEARLRFGWVAVTRRHRGMQWTPPRWYRFETPGEFWPVIEREVKAGWRALLVAHNVGFDFRVCDGFNELQHRGWKMTGAVIDDPPTILRYRRGRQGIMVLDTLNYYRTSLKELGKNLGLEKLEHDFKWGNREVDDAYCRRDCEIVLRGMQAIIRRVADLDLGNFSTTFPALAFTAFRHRHMHTPVLIDDNPRALSLSRSGYYGGRTEAFRLGVIPEPVEVYDVVSMYPSVMRDEPVPTVLRGFYRSMTVSELTIAATDTAAVADVTLDTDQADYPVLRDGKLLFPVGRYRTILAPPELRHALQRGRVVECHDVALYDEAILFRSFIDEWWERRLDAIKRGDAAEALFCKLMMNALYGKFGQTGRVFETVGTTLVSKVDTWVEIDLETGLARRMRSLGGLVQRMSGEVESRDSHPAIAATITSAARVKLLSLIEAAGRGSVIYVDTDSMFRLSSAPADMLSKYLGNGLGQLKWEKRITELVIRGLKDYSADGIRKTKGIRSNAVQVAPNMYRQDTFVGLKGAVQRGDVRRQVILKSVKRLSLTYDKGSVDGHGVISPFVFNEA